VESKSTVTLAGRASAPGATSASAALRSVGLRISPTTRYGRPAARQVSPIPSPYSPASAGESATWSRAVG